MTLPLPAKATVYEFGSGGSVVVYEANDYLSKSRHRAHKAYKQDQYPDIKYEKIVGQAAILYDVDPRLVHAVISTESAYNPSAVSPKGASGLMQLMPETAKSYGVEDSFDPSQNIDGGVHLLSDLIKLYDGNITLALAAYNAGPGAVEKYDGVPPYDETNQYIERIENLLDTTAEQSMGAYNISNY